MEKKPKVSVIPAEDLLSTGSTCLDLGLSGRLAGGLAKGMYFLFVGDSGSGKTFLFNTCFAEAAANPNFDDYTLVADMPEDGAKMDYAGHFGQKCADRVEVIEPSRLLEQFYDRVEERFAKGPCIYVLDSENALTCQALLDLYGDQKTARAKGKEEPKSYGTEKAKIHSSRMPHMIDLMQKSRSILVIVAQTRQKLGASRYEKQTTRSGGIGLTFYAQALLWMKIAKRLKKKVNDQERHIGIISSIRIEKNRLSGKDRTVEVPIYNSTGIDDTGGIIDYLIQEKHWPTKTGKLKADEFDFIGTKDELIKRIEEEDEERELKAVALECWEGVEEQLRVVRKMKYQ